MMVAAAQSVPANHAIRWIAQPDGAKFAAEMKGDEYQGWMETVDGYTVIKNASTGYFEYAAKDAAGKLVPSGIVVYSDNQLTKVAVDRRPPKHLRPSNFMQR